jgi:hypothetical protein
MLAKGLSSDIQKALVATLVPASYDAYCSLLHTVSHNLESLCTKDRAEWVLKKKGFVEDSTMDWEPTTTQVANAQAQTRGKDKSKGKTKFRGQCYNCGQDGHMARDCPDDSGESEPQKAKKKPKAAPARRTKKQKKQKKEKAPKDDEESLAASSESSSDDSGKE